MKIAKLIFATSTMMVCSSMVGFAQHDNCKMGASGHDHTKKEASATSKSDNTINQSDLNITGLKTSTYMVSGNCGMCKSTIEKAASVMGVSEAKWDIETKILTLAYDANLITGDTVLKHIADAGYDNEKFKATDMVYNALPGCCKYERTQEDKK